MKKKLIMVWIMIVSALFIMTGCGKGGDYKNAMSLYENGQYQEAATKFVELGDYENSSQMVTVCRYETAKELFDEGSYDEAKKIFEELDDYENSTQFVTDCDYYKAENLFKNKDYEAAIGIYETIKEYKDSADKIQAAEKNIMLQKYGDVFSALDGKTWYFNGGSDTILNRISFSDTTATISQISFDDNYHKSDNGSNDFAFSVNDESIVITTSDGNELLIGYDMSDDGIHIGENEYFTIEEIDTGLQGIWTYRYDYYLLGMRMLGEYNVSISNGTIISENASIGINLPDGAYYYYGPDQGTYTLNFGGFDTDLRGGNEWFYNIINGKVTLFHADNKMTLAEDQTSLPGEDGYSF